MNKLAGLALLAVSAAQAAPILDTFASTTYTGQPVYSTTVNGGTAIIAAGTDYGIGRAQANAAYGNLSVNLLAPHQGNAGTSAPLLVGTAAATTSFADTLQLDPGVASLQFRYEWARMACCASFSVVDLNVTLGQSIDDPDSHAFSTTFTVPITPGAPVSIGASLTVAVHTLNRAGEGNSMAETYFKIRSLTALNSQGSAVDVASYLTESGSSYAFTNANFAGTIPAGQIPEPSSYILLSSAGLLLLLTRVWSRSRSSSVP